MRRTILTASVAAIATLATTALFWKPSSSPAQPANAALVQPPAAGGPQLPVAQVVLFSSGVGYFQREGAVQGNARIDLTFQVKDINDLLNVAAVGAWPRSRKNGATPTPTARRWRSSFWRSWTLGPIAS